MGWSHTFRVSALFVIVLLLDFKMVLLQSSDCSLEDKRGTCTEYVVKWYYDSEYGKCAQFWYGGCGGNNNRFDDEDKCKQKCQGVGKGMEQHIAIVACFIEGCNMTSC